MAVGSAVIIIGALAIAIYAVIELQRFKHKLFAIFLIGILILGYVSFTVVFKGKDVDITSIDGIKMASKTYFAWMGSIFGNMKMLTSNAVKMDWAEDPSSDPQKEE